MKINFWNRYKAEHYWWMGLINPFMLLGSMLIFYIELNKK